MWCRRRHQAALAGNQPVKFPPKTTTTNKHNSIYTIVYIYIYVYLCSVSTGIFLGGRNFHLLLLFILKLPMAEDFALYYISPTVSFADHLLYLLCW